MNSHNHPDDLLDVSLRHSLKNWTVHKEPPSGIREQLLAAAKHKKITTKPSKSIRWGLSGWSFQFQYTFNEVSFRTIYQYNMEALYSLKAMAIS
jgi:hypothetical protein